MLLMCVVQAFAFVPADSVWFLPGAALVASALLDICHFTHSKRT